MAIWMVLLLISPGVTHMTKSLCGSKEGGGTKMTLRTSDISCWLSARCLASPSPGHSSSSRLPFTAWWLQGFKRTKARGARSLKDQAPKLTEYLLVKQIKRPTQIQGEGDNRFHLFMGRAANAPYKGMWTWPTTPICQSS